MASYFHQVVIGRCLPIFYQQVPPHTVPTCSHHPTRHLHRSSLVAFIVVATAPASRRPGRSTSHHTCRSLRAQP